MRLGHLLQQAAHAQGCPRTPRPAAAAAAAVHASRPLSGPAEPSSCIRGSTSHMSSCLGAHLHAGWVSWARHAIWPSSHLKPPCAHALAPLPHHSRVLPGCRRGVSITGAADPAGRGLQWCGSALPGLSPPRIPGRTLQRCVRLPRCRALTCTRACCWSCPRRRMSPSSGPTSAHSSAWERRDASSQGASQERGLPAFLVTHTANLPGLLVAAETTTGPTPGGMPTCA